MVCVLGVNSIGGFIEDLCLGSACFLLPECLRETKEKHILLLSDLVLVGLRLARISASKKVGRKAAGGARACMGNPRGPPPRFCPSLRESKRLWFLAASIIKRQGGYLAAGNFLFSKYVVQFKTILFKEVGVHVAVLHDGMGGKHSCRSVYLSVLT